MGTLTVSGDPHAAKRLRKIFSRNQMLAHTKAIIDGAKQQGRAAPTRVNTKDQPGARNLMAPACKVVDVEPCRTCSEGRLTSAQHRLRRVSPASRGCAAHL